MNPNDLLPDLEAANPAELDPHPEPIIPEDHNYRIVSKIGITRKSHEESKTRRKMAAKSRKINRRK